VLKDCSGEGVGVRREGGGGGWSFYIKIAKKVLEYF
jgi:hypothetical protein